MNILYNSHNFHFNLIGYSAYVSKIIDKKKKHKIEIQKYINENNTTTTSSFSTIKMAAMGEMLGILPINGDNPLSVITTASTGMKLQKSWICFDDEAFNQSVTNRLCFYIYQKLLMILEISSNR